VKDKALLKKELEDYLKKSSDDQEGNEIDRERVREQLQATIDNLEEADAVKYGEVTSKFLEVSLLGMPEGFDPHSMLRGLAYPFLVLMKDSFIGDLGASVASLIMLEIMYREKKLIGDWLFLRQTNVSAEVRYTAAAPISFLQQVVSEESN
jgi:hypothetical protein